jgi:hypothetical protein
LKWTRSTEDIALTPVPQLIPLRSGGLGLEFELDSEEWAQRSWLRADSQRMSPSGRWSTNDETKSVPMVSDTFATTLPAVAGAVMSDSNP